MWKKVLFTAIIGLFVILLFGSTTARAAGCDPNNIIFSEIDYDQPGTDNNEFLELRIINAVSISNCEIRLINGSNNATYDTIDLTGNWGPNQYLLIGSTNIANRDLTFGGGACASNCLQNGAPDGFALVDTSTGTGTVVWFYSYEGTITEYDAGDGTLVDSTPLTNNGTAVNDTGDESVVNGPATGVDDCVDGNPTPGTANQDLSGTPTAIILADIAASNGLSNAVIIALLVGFSALLFLGFWLRRRTNH
ncbi:MAG TPA: hypothetical protein ENK60_08460 [Anaerolineae bacterium]|nr:hypothetical protein [Anaerolineae bacterium]